MGRLVSNFGEGGALEILAEVFFSFCVRPLSGIEKSTLHLFCLPRPILPPKKIESGEKLGWTP